MKPNSLGIDQYGSLGGTKTSMSVKAEDMPHIMGLLTSAYSDTDIAIIREYSTNGWDSHVEAGNSDPIRVTTPTRLDPYFSVQDFGIGMSEDDINLYFANYGASSKRDTNEQSGMMGIGCKAALAHAAQFSIDAVKNGVKTLAVVARTAAGGGEVEIVSTSSTSEPNGVKVSIPMQYDRDFEIKARKFFKYWKKGTVLLDGSDPSMVDGFWVTPDICMVTGNDLDHVVMGNVPYRIQRDYSILGDVYYRRVQIVAYVPIGSVDFTPSREDLRYSHQTKSVLSGIEKELKINLERVVGEKLDSCSTKPEALKTWYELQNKFSHVNGFSIPKRWKSTTVPTTFKALHTRFDPSAKRYQTDDYRQCDGNVLLSKSLIVTGYEEDTLTTSQKQKLRKILARDGATGPVYLFKDASEVPLDWASGPTVMTWDDVKSTKFPAAKRNTNVSVYRVKRLASPGYLVDVEEIDSTKPVYYASKTEDIDLSTAVKLFSDDDQVLFLSSNRHAKLVRMFPHAKPIRVGLNAAAQKIFNSAPAEVVKAWGLNDSELLRRLDKTKVEDPELVAEIELAHVDTSKWDVQLNRAYLFHRVDRYGKSVLSSKYSMAEDYYVRWGHPHLYIYFNAVYNETKGK